MRNTDTSCIVPDNEWQFYWHQNEFNPMKFLWQRKVSILTSHKRKAALCQITRNLSAILWIYCLSLVFLCAWFFASIDRSFNKEDFPNKIASELGFQGDISKAEKIYFVSPPKHFAWSGKQTPCVSQCGSMEHRLGCHSSMLSGASKIEE